MASAKWEDTKVMGKGSASPVASKEPFTKLRLRVVTVVSRDYTCKNT